MSKKRYGHYISVASYKILNADKFRLKNEDFEKEIKI